MDRYSKFLLTVIAGALVYLCVILTPLPSVSAQARTPGEITTGRVEAVIVGVQMPKGEPLPVSVFGTVPVTIGDTVRVAGSVTTERSSGKADRVMIAGWEDLGVPEKAGRPQRIDLSRSSGLPVTTMPR